MGQIPVFLVNLDDATERLSRMAARFKALGLSFERFPAVRGSALSEAEKRAVCPKRHLWYYRRDMTDPEIGCFLSHRAILAHIVEEGIPRACVIEDDVLLAADFPLWVASDTPLPEGADLVKLQGTISEEPRLGLPLLTHGGRRLAFMAEPSMGTGAYLVTCEGARRALGHLAVMRMPIDHALFEYWENGLMVYEVSPLPVSHEGSDSHIDDERLTPPVKRRSLARSIKRRWRRIALPSKKVYFWVTRFGRRAFARVPLPR